MVTEHSSLKTILEFKNNGISYPPLSVRVPNTEQIFRLKKQLQEIKVILLLIGIICNKIALMGKRIDNFKRTIKDYLERKKITSNN